MIKPREEENEDSLDKEPQVVKSAEDLLKQERSIYIKFGDYHAYIPYIVQEDFGNYKVDDEIYFHPYADETDSRKVGFALVNHTQKKSRFYAALQGRAALLALLNTQLKLIPHKKKGKEQVMFLQSRLKDVVLYYRLEEEYPELSGESK
jgi:hypothetical protein